jgi:hypothetical protein
VIQLVGVLAEDGVPVRIRTYANIESASVLSGIIELLKGLSSAMQLGQVQRLKFQDYSLLITEAEKGYSIIALVDKAEGYAEGLLRVIRIAIDDSSIVKAKEPVTETLRSQVDAILNFHLQERLDVTWEEVIDPVWLALLERMKQQGKYSQVICEVDAMIRASKEPDVQWEKLETKAKGSLSDALSLALSGQFDKACAIALQVDNPLAQLFAVKTGLLALSMTRTAAPQLYELRRIAETLPLKYQPFAELAYGATLYYDRLMPYQDYLRIYQSTASHFQFRNNEEDLIIAFLFIDTRVVTLPDFAQNLAAYFKNKSPIIHSYLLAMIDREQLFSKLYSITSYTDFKDQVSAWKTKITIILNDVNQFLKPGFLRKLLRRKPEAGLTGSLNLGTYIALYTALAESPVLNLRERKEVLEEVLRVYLHYFRKLLDSKLPLFTYTVDSIFQSVSVASAEMFYLLSEEAQHEHILKIKSYLREVLSVVNTDWLRKHPDTSTLFVISNATFPVLFSSDAIDKTEVRLIYLAMRMLNTMALMKARETNPVNFATDLLNIKTSLATLSICFLQGEKINQVLEGCVDLLLRAHKFFITQGMLCRDDIASATLLTGHLNPERLANDFSVYVDSAIALNRIAVPDEQRHESDIAVLAVPYLHLLGIASKHLKDDKYVELAQIAYDQSLKVWNKYGFAFKAQEFSKQYGSWLKH